MVLRDRSIYDSYLLSCLLHLTIYDVPNSRVRTLGVTDTNLETSRWMVESLRPVQELKKSKVRGRYLTLVIATDGTSELTFLIQLYTLHILSRVVYSFVRVREFIRLKITTTTTKQQQLLQNNNNWTNQRNKTTTIPYPVFQISSTTVGSLTCGTHYKNCNRGLVDLPQKGSVRFIFPDRRVYCSIPIT